MAAYAQNPNLKPLPPLGNYPQGSYQQAYQQQYQQQQHQQHQHQQYLQQQQPGPDGIHRPPSFVGLPPIRRASTFGSSLGLTAEEFSASDNNAAGASRQQQTQQSQQSQQAPPATQGASSQPAMAAQQQQQQQQGQQMSHQFMPASQPSGQFVQNVYRPTQGAHGPQGTQGQAQQGQTWQLQGQNAVQAQAFPNAAFQHAAMRGQGPAQVPARAFGPSPGNAPATMNGSVPQMTQGQQFAPAGGGPMMVPPHMLPGNLMQRFHPQGGGWNLQESHLSEPLQPTSRHRHSPSNASSQQQQPSYGFDKETGVPSSTSPIRRQKPLGSQQTEQTPQNQQAQQTGTQQPSSLPSQETQSASPQPNQANHQSPAGQHPEGAALTRLQSHQSHQTDLARPGVVPGSEDGQSKRNSGVFSSLRGRFAGGHSDSRHGSEGVLKPQAADGDAASMASIVSEEQQRRNPIFGPKGGVPTPDNMSYSQSKDSVVAHGPGTPLGERMQSAQPSQFAPPGRKPTGFFHIGSHTTPIQPGGQARPDMPRTSTSTNATEHKHTPSNGGPTKKRFSALKDVFRSSPREPKNSFTVRMPAQSPNQFPPQFPPQVQYQGGPQAPPQGPTQPSGPSPQPAQTNTPTPGPGPQPSPANASLVAPSPGPGPTPGPAPAPAPTSQPGSANGQPSGQERIASAPATGLRQPGYGLPPMQPPQGPIPNQNQDRKPSAGIFGFLRSRSDSKSQETPQQPAYPFGPGQHAAFPPGQGPPPGHPGQQFGMRMPLGPDGRLLTGASQQAYAGQFPPQSQFIQQGPPGIANSFQSQGAVGGQRPGMPSPQPSGAQGQEPGVQVTGQRPPMTTQPTQSLIQTPSESKPGPDQQQGPATSLQQAQQQAQQQATPQQEPAKPVEPTPAASIVDSPVSQHSQPATQFAIEQTRFQTDSPVSLRQPFAAPQTGLNQMNCQTPGAQNAAPAPSEQQPITQKPVQPPSLSATDRSAAHGTESGDDDIQRPVSPASQAQVPLSGIPGEQMERIVPATGTPFQSMETRLPSRQSPSAALPGQGATQSAQTPGSAPGASGLSQPPPSQQSNQPEPRPPTGQQGPGQGYPAGQGPWIVSQTGAAPPQFRQQFGPGNARPNGVPANAPAKEKEQSTFSKLLFGGKSSGPTAPAPKPEKEKGSKPSLMSAFKRKPTDLQSAAQTPPGRPVQGQPTAGMVPFGARPQAQPQQPAQQQQGPGPRPGIMAQQPSPQQGSPAASQLQVQGQPQPKPNVPVNQQLPPQQQAPRQVRAPEPQYDQVPIPAGYGYVHGEGRVAPAPAHIFVGSGLPAGQVFPPGFPQQQWAQPGASIAQGTPAGVAQPAGPQQANGVQTPLPSQSTSTPQSSTPAPQVQDRAPPAAEPSPATEERSGGAAKDEQTPPQAAAQAIQQPQPTLATPATRAADVSPQSSTPTPAPQGAEPSVSPPEEQVQRRPEPARLHSQESNISPPPQIQYVAPAQSYQPPHPPVAPATNEVFHGRNLSEDGISSLPSQRPGRVQPLAPNAAPANPGLTAQPANASPTPQPTPGWRASPLPSAQANSDMGRDSRAVSPEPAAQGIPSGGNNLTTPTQRVADDNIYDATPRQSQFPPQQQQQPQQQAQAQPQPQHSDVASHQQFPPQQQHQPHADVPNNTILINGSVEPKSAGLSHDVTRPQHPTVVTVEQPPQQHPTSNPGTVHDHDHVHDEDDDDLDFDTDMESPVIQDASIATVQQASPSNSTSPTAAAAAAAAAQNGGAAAKDSVAIFERAKKKAEEQREAEMRLVLEEKIPVFSAEEMEDGAGGGGRKKEEEVPQMSATSYPGQEWNPYGEGGFEDWE